jgi:hypothetical protein
LEFTYLQSIPELSFKNGENSFDLVSLMIAVLVERAGQFSSIDPGYPFSFSGSDWNKRVSVQVVTDESVNIFRIVSFIEDIGLRLSCSVTLNEKFFGVRDIVNRLLGDLKPGDDLSVNIDGDGCFQEPFSGLTGSPGII